jgi:hypothetical protein
MQNLIIECIKMLRKLTIDNWVCGSLLVCTWKQLQWHFWYLQLYPLVIQIEIPHRLQSLIINNLFIFKYIFKSIFNLNYINISSMQYVQIIYIYIYIYIYIRFVIPHSFWGIHLSLLKVVFYMLLLQHWKEIEIMTLTSKVKCMILDGFFFGWVLDLCEVYNFEV